MGGERGERGEKRGKERGGKERGKRKERGRKRKGKERGGERRGKERGGERREERGGKARGKRKERGREREEKGRREEGRGRREGGERRGSTIEILMLLHRRVRFLSHVFCGDGLTVFLCHLKSCQLLRIQLGQDGRGDQWASLLRVLLWNIGDENMVGLENTQP